MIETTSFARPYAKAAFEVAESQGEIDSWARFLALLASVIDRPEVAELFGNPQMNRQRLLVFLEGICADVLGADFASGQRNFLALLAENERLRMVSAISERFGELADAVAGVALATITVAFEPDKAAVERLVKAIEAHRNSRIRAEIRVDPSLIGGVKIAVGDRVIDASVREKLNSMARALTQ